MTVDFSKDMMIGMLRKGNTGNQLLDILNVIAPEIDSTESESIAAKATLEPIAFWSILLSVLYPVSLMFISCPVSFDLIDAEWYENFDDAKEDAFDWSIELSGENVIVYEAIEEEDGDYEFKKLYSIYAWY